MFWNGFSSVVRYVAMYKRRHRDESVWIRGEVLELRSYERTNSSSVVKVEILHFDFLFDFLNLVKVEIFYAYRSEEIIQFLKCETGPPVVFTRLNVAYSAGS